MNYRHSFHAGNFADVFKHVTASRIIAALCAKEKPFRVIDTHAGAGLYDLGGEEASRSGEWRGGVALFDAAKFSRAAEGLLAPYRTTLQSARRDHGARAYPGSPEIFRRLMRASDRLLLAEAHAPTAALLQEAMRGDRRVKCLIGDGWRLAKAAIPPPERRGLVFIDPAFELRDEFAAAASAFPALWRKWPTGIYALWYPVKDVALVEGFMQELRERGLRKALRAELFVDDPRARGLNASGMIIINPPWPLAAEIEILAPELAERFARGRAQWRCDWLAPEGDRKEEEPAPRSGAKHGGFGK